MDLPVNNLGSVDVYINDVLLICPNIGNNAKHCTAAVPLALHIIGCLMDPAKKPMPHDDLLSLKTLAGEGRNQEIKIILIVRK